MTQYNQVQQYYAERLIQIVENLPRKPKYIIWQDPIENNVTVSLVVQYVDILCVQSIWSCMSCLYRFNSEGTWETSLHGDHTRIGKQDPILWSVEGDYV